jgi:tripartite-type tricarboxylate transporter receptor subunit TctC
VSTWYGLWAPKGTPADVQARIVEEVNRVAAADEIKASWASNGAEFGKLTQAQFGAFVSAEVKRWAAVVKASGARLD